MSENHSKLDPEAWSYVREKIGRLLREMYNEPKEPSAELSALIAKLRYGAPLAEDETYPATELNQTATK